MGIHFAAWKVLFGNAAQYNAQLTACPETGTLDSRLAFSLGLDSTLPCTPTSATHPALEAVSGDCLACYFRSQYD